MIEILKCEGFTATIRSLSTGIQYYVELDAHGVPYDVWVKEDTVAIDIRQEVQIDQANPTKQFCDKVYAWWDGRSTAMTVEECEEDLWRLVGFPVIGQDLSDLMENLVTQHGPVLLKLIEREEDDE